MLHQLASRNDDITRLVEKGYALAIDSNYLVARDIPYIDAQGALRVGAIVTKLEFIDAHRVVQADHQIFFAGSVPHGLNGAPIRNLGGGPTTLGLSSACKDVVVERSFSNKPTTSGTFLDFFEKLESYVAVISGPAIVGHGASPYTFRVVEEAPADSIFKLRDTLTSRAEITDLASRFTDEVVAVVGLGGTGAYVLDYLVKTPVREIRAFDLDPYHVHNAFRSPGRMDPVELGQSKAAVYQSRYDSFRNGLIATAKVVDSSCTQDLQGVTFAFVCVDKGPARAAVFDLLISMRIPFIDVGMGVKRRDGSLNGMLRVTYYSAEDSQMTRDRGFAELADAPDDLYRTNIQISELNALNACLAVIRFKQLRGFYAEDCPHCSLLFEIADLKIVSE